MNPPTRSDSHARRLRILLIAYEFPPSPSPQSLRWAYLAGRLAERGHEVHVMAPDISGVFAGLPTLGSELKIHRIYPGPVRWLLGRLASRRPSSSTIEQVSRLDAPAEIAAGPSRLNWKGRLLERLQLVVSWTLFPDLRGEWLRPALRVLPDLLNQVQPDVVISSHEPATTLQIGLATKACGYPWVADLADPVLAAYTPPRWRQRAKKLEEATLEHADQVLVTTLRTAQVLQARHKTDMSFTLIEQGFDERFTEPRPPHTNRDDAPLELLYAGSFYSFRDPSVLVKAVVGVPGARLSIASSNVPDWLLSEVKRYPDSLRLLGCLPHRQILSLQRRADVLVNLANNDSAQVPGKFYEYLGAGRPILHVQADEKDAAAVLLEQLRRGWSVLGTREGIVTALTQLRLHHKAGCLCSGLDLSPDIVAPWSWSAAAARLEAPLYEAVHRGDLRR